MRLIFLPLAFAFALNELLVQLAGTPLSLILLEPSKTVG